MQLPVFLRPCILMFIQNAREKCQVWVVKSTNLVVLLLFYILSQVPSGPPQNLTGSFINSTALNFSWEPPCLEDRNGMIRNYTYTYFISKEIMNKSDVTEATSFVLTGLEEYTEYNITVQANTINGSGPGVSTVVWTELDSKFVSIVV